MEKVRNGHGSRNYTILIKETQHLLRSRIIIGRPLLVLKEGAEKVQNSFFSNCWLSTGILEEAVNSNTSLSLSILIGVKVICQRGTEQVKEYLLGRETKVKHVSCKDDASKKRK